MIQIGDIVRLEGSHHKHRVRGMRRDDVGRIYYSIENFSYKISSHRVRLVEKSNSDQRYTLGQRVYYRPSPNTSEEESIITGISLAHMMGETGEHISYQLMRLQSGREIYGAHQANLRPAILCTVF